MTGTVSEVILATAGYDHTIRFWEALSGICLRTIQFPDSQVNKIVISPDKRFIVAAGNPQVRLYDVQSNSANSITSFEGHTGNVTSVGFQSAGRWLCTGSEDGNYIWLNTGTVKIWDIRAPGIQRDYKLNTPVNDVLIHPNQGELITGDQSGSIKIWDLTENSCTHELIPEEDVPVRSVSMAVDGSLLMAANNKGNVYSWKSKASGTNTEFEALSKLAAHSKYITKCLLSPDTKLLATCSADNTIKLWDTTNYKFKLDKVLSGHQRWVWDCSFSADSAYLVTGSSDHTARLWDLSNGETIRHYNGHQKAVTCVALHDRVKSKSSVGNVSLITPRFQKGKFSVPLSANPEAENENPAPIPTKKSLTDQDKELLDACESGDIDKVYVKLWDKANVNCKRPVYGSTPLAVACRKGYPKIVNVLLEFGANMSSDDFGCSPLHWAANSGKPQIINSLIKKAHLSIDDLHKKDQFGSTALHFASVKNLTENVQTLIAAGTNPSITNNDGKKASEITSSTDIRGILVGNIKENTYTIEREQKLEQSAKNAAKKSKRRIKPKIKEKFKPVSVSKAVRSLPDLKGKSLKKDDSVKKAETPPINFTTTQKLTVAKKVLATKHFTPL